RVHVTDAKGKRVRCKWLQDRKVGAVAMRCRFVAMQVACQAREDAFAGAPPLKFVRLALVLAAAFRNHMKVYLIGLSDISSAFSHAEMGEDACAVPPSGEEGPNVVWQLRMALCGTRGASKPFQRKVIGASGLHPHVGDSDGVLPRPEGIYIVVHGNDFMAVGALEDLRWLNEILEAEFEVKRAPFVGPAEAGGEATSGHFLKRTVSWTEKGFHCESDAKHARTVVEAYGKLPAAREISPASQSIGKKVPTALDRLGYAQKKLFQSAAPTALYLAADGPDLQFATSWIVRGMQEPLVLHELELKRLAAYLATHPQMMWNFEYQELPSEVTIVTDAATRALSSGEAECVEMTNGAARGILAKNLSEEMGIKMTVKVCGDSAAAIGVRSRLGAGRIRLPGAKYLRMRGEVAEKEVRAAKVPTAENVADLIAK
ncbi:unnamed protein product, partial [Prorocentrum cordatum]